MKPDVEEAIGRLTDWSVELPSGDRFPRLAADIRTLLDAYASREAEVKEAVRLMKPFVSYDFPEADGWYGAYQLELFAGEREGLIDSFTVEDFRALSTYVTNHEASDGK